MNQTTTTRTESSGYHSYLLRLWFENGDGDTWRLSLQDIHTGARTGFACLEDLLNFLREQMQPDSLIDLGVEMGKEKENEK